MLITNKLPNSLSAESYKSLRNNIEKIAERDNIKTLLITSSVSGEGKSTISGNLAVSLSENNNKVFVIDCELRRPSLHNKFDIENEYGVGEVLLGDCKLKSAIKKINSNLFILTAGKVSNNTSELLATNNMKELLDEVRINYDYIIINSASIIPVSDTRVLANNVDAAILVVRSNKSTNKNVIDGYNKLKDTGINILGIILNDINSKSLKKLYKEYSINNKK